MTIVQKHLWVVAATLALGACANPDAPDGLRLDLTTDKTQVATADSVRLTLRLTNVSWRSVEVMPAEAYGFCFHAFQLFTADGREVPVPTALCVTLLSLVVPQPVNLKPGERIVITDWWHPASTWLDGEPLAPGVYRLRGRASAESGNVVSAPQSVTLLP